MLVDEQRAFTRVCLKREPSEDDLSTLGGQRERYLLYRDMVRTRLFKMTCAALPRTSQALGPEAHRMLFDTWLDEAPPRSRFIREVMSAFAAFAVPAVENNDRLASWLPDLARYEIARWDASYDPSAMPLDICEFSFEKIPVVNPTLRLLALRHRVQNEPLEGSGYEGCPTWVAVYRRPDTDRVANWIMKNELSADLLRAWKEGDRSVTQTVKEVTTAHEVAITESFVESLGTMLADFIERGIILGSR